MKLRSSLALGSCSTALLVLVTAFAQDEPLLDDPLLHDELAQHEDRQYPSGVPFREAWLSCRFYQSAIVDSVVNDANGEPAVLLTSVPTNFARYKLFPNIVHRAPAGHWVRTPIPNTSDGWTHVHVSADRQHLLISMDNVPESAGWNTRFVISGDGGRSWRYGQSVRKYIYFDVIGYLGIDDTGTGTAVEHYTGGVGGYDEVGYYVFETGDWGATWSERVYEEELDTSGLVDVLPGHRQMREAQTPLSEISLPGFDEC